MSLSLFFYLSREDSHLFQVVSNSKFVLVGVQSPTEINAPLRRRTAVYNIYVASDRYRCQNMQGTFCSEEKFGDGRGEKTNAGTEF